MPETENPPAAAKEPARNGGFFRWIGKLRVLMNLSFLTVLSGAAVSYIQYVNAYQEKVGHQAQEDMKLATDTFTEISTAFSNTLALQNLLYSNFRSAISGKSDTSATALATRNARDASRTYEKAQRDLREKIDLLTQKAQIYFDWISDLGRDPAKNGDVEPDPLSLTVLRNYQFNCSDPLNFPKFGDADAVAPDKRPAEIPDDKFCASEHEQFIGKGTPQGKAFIRICPSDPKRGDAVKIHWFSARHHVLTMQYCFDAMHAQFEPVRQWASQSDRDPARESEIVARTEQITAALDDLASRLKSFNSLALFQLARIQVKYRPTSFECSVPGLRAFYDQTCLPLAVAPTKRS